jgi:F0F1-type ATP synthase gamma subunit
MTRQYTAYQIAIIVVGVFGVNNLANEDLALINRWAEMQEGKGLTFEQIQELAEDAMTFSTTESLPSNGLSLLVSSLAFAVRPLVKTS